MGSQNEVPAAWRTVNNVISKSNRISLSAMTRGCLTRPPESAYSQAFETPDASLILLWPLPEDDITGFTKQGYPTPRSMPICSSSSVDANAYFDVGRRSSS